MSVTAFRAYKPRRKVKLDPLAHVIAQMQGLLDSSIDETLTEEEQAFRGLVVQWHGMLLAALVDEAKHGTHSATA